MYLPGNHRTSIKAAFKPPSNFISQCHQCFSIDPVIKLSIAMIMRKFMPYIVKSDRREANFPTPNFPIENMKKLDEQMKQPYHLFVIEVIVVVFDLLLPLRHNLKDMQIQKTIKSTRLYLKNRP